MVRRNLYLGTALAILAAAPAFSQTPIAAQMYTLRDYGSLDEQLAAVAAADITAIETVGTQDVTSEELNALLTKHGIEVISSHVQLADLRNDIAKVVAFNKAVGNDVITVPYLTEDMRPTDEAGWQALGAELRGFADTLKAEDMRLTYHNHDFEMVEYGDKTALEILLDAAGPEVKSELDLAWVARGGHDPAEFLNLLDGRVFAVHAKDNAPEGTAVDERGFATVGSGTLNWATILPAAQEAGAEWYIIEHDQPRDAAEVMTKGAEFLRENLPD